MWPRFWFTRCPVPTATGIAADLGRFDQEFGPDGIVVSSLQDQPGGPLAGHHFEHGLATLFREGGNVPALWTRSRGQATRLIGLTWIEERQAIVVRHDSVLEGVGDLRGRRVAVPDRRSPTVDFWRAMALHGFSGALRSVGLSLNDVVAVDVAPRSAGDAYGPQGGEGTGGAMVAVSRANGWQPELEALVADEVDAVYVKGAAAVDASAAVGARVLLDLDRLEDRRLRVNNGTPRPITVHQSLLDARPDVVARFLAVLLETSDWATTHRAELSTLLEAETGAGAEGVKAAYRGDFHLSLHPDLSDERLELLAQQEQFLLGQGFLEAHVDVHAWAAYEPLIEARELLAAGRPVRDRGDNEGPDVLDRPS